MTAWSLTEAICIVPTDLGLDPSIHWPDLEPVSIPTKPQCPGIGQRHHKLQIQPPYFIADEWNMD